MAFESPSPPPPPSPGPAPAAPGSAPHSQSPPISVPPFCAVRAIRSSVRRRGSILDAVPPETEAERKKRDETDAGKSYCSRRFGGATCDDKSAQIYARFDKNDWRIQPAEFYRFHDAEVNPFGYF